MKQVLIAILIVSSIPAHAESAFATVNPIIGNGLYAYGSMLINSSDNYDAMRYFWEAELDSALQAEVGPVTVGKNPQSGAAFLDDGLEMDFCGCKTGVSRISDSKWIDNEGPDKNVFKFGTLTYTRSCGGGGSQ